MKTQNGWNFLSNDERDKIKHEIQFFDETGLYGQFPNGSSGYEVLKSKMKDLFAQAEENVLAILSTDGFKDFRSYMDGPRCYSLIAENLHDIITGKARASQNVLIWNMNRGDNKNLMLVIHESKLKLCVAEYVYQDEHMKGQGVHWHRILSDRQILEHDNYRLNSTLEILANPKTAWEYLRAMVYAREVHLNNP